MSRFSGKCDLRDHFMIDIDHDVRKGLIPENTTPFEYYQTHNINMWWSKAFHVELNPESGEWKSWTDDSLKIQVNKPSELAGLYPHVVSMGSFNGEGETIFLMDRPWPEIESEKYGDEYGIREYYKEELDREIERLVREEDPKYE